MLIIPYNPNGVLNNLFKREVWEEIKRQLPLKYPKEQLEKFSHYMFGVDYAVIMGILEMKGSDRTCRKCESTF